MISLHQAKKDFSWLGEVLAVHSIGPYDLVEYWHDPSKFHLQDEPRDLRRVKNWGTYVNDKKTSISYGSMDEALAGCIAYRAEGPNCQAAHFFIRGIGLGDHREYEKED